MLRYWPFVRGCGFHYAGETQGNEHRAARDMKYLVSRKLRSKKLPEGGGGIMWAQRSYAETIVRTIQHQKTSIDEIIRLLQVAPEKLTDEQWLHLHSVYRRPKPTYIAGLTEAATKYLEVQARHREALARPSATPQAPAESSQPNPIRLVGLAIIYRGRGSCRPPTVGARPSSATRASARSPPPYRPRWNAARGL